jgi:hypothetical protein
MSSTKNGNKDDPALQDAAKVDPLVHEMKVNDNEGDDKNTSGDDVLADKKESHSREIDLLHDSIVEKLKREE